jgi:hypothetical protein
MFGCPILRAFCEGWDKQNVREKGLGEQQWYPTLSKKREGWGTRTRTLVLSCKMVRAF